ncbi:MAG: hypothetical protein CVV44_01770 [Spirochaetae bacterium HGW-Spirochaetae-1]|jgi:TolB-like protein|nr:MAG: hypothetical protein CVV44_01770 [Spirochaetae bacterium HGW-Spirochaetae-1]
MKKIAAAVLLLVMGAVFHGWTEAPKHGIAVAPFDNPFCEAVEKQCVSFAATLEKKFPLIDIFSLRKAGAVVDYLKNLALMQAGILSDRSLASDMKNLSIEYITVGTISVFDGRYEVDERVVNIDTWEVVQTCGVSTDSMDYAVEAICYDMKEALRGPLTGKGGSTRPVLSIRRFTGQGGAGEGSAYGDAMAEMINTGLGRVGDIALIERKFSGALVMEKELEMAGIVEHGKVLSAFRDRGIGYSVSGEIRIFPDVICVTYRVNNTNCGAPVSMGYHEIATSRAFRPLAERITDDIRNILVKKMGTLSLDILPADARVYVDNVLYDFRDSFPLEAGSHVLAIERDGYENVEERISITAGNVESRQFRLKRDGQGKDSPGRSGFGNGKTEWERRVWGEYEKRKDVGKPSGNGRVL